MGHGCSDSTNTSLPRDLHTGNLIFQESQGHGVLAVDRSTHFQPALQRTEFPATQPHLA